MRFWTGGVLWRGLYRKDQEGRMQFLCGRGGRVWSDCRGTGLPLMSCLQTDQSAGAVSSEVDSNHRAGLGWRDSDALQANPSGASTLPCCGRRGKRPTIQLGICLRRGPEAPIPSRYAHCPARRWRHGACRAGANPSPHNQASLSANNLPLKFTPLCPSGYLIHLARRLFQASSSVSTQRAVCPAAAEQ